MKKASITLTVLAFVFFFLAFIGGFMNTYMTLKGHMGPHLQIGLVLREINIGYYLIGLGFYVVFGLIAHILAMKGMANNVDGLVGVYIVTFPAYLAPFVILFILWAFIKFIDIMLGMFTDGKCSVAVIVKYLYDALFGSAFKTKNTSSSDVYVVLDEHSNERKLQFTEQKQDHDPDSPLYTKHYNRFRDDIGNYWRSYDNNQTFVKETAEQTSRGY